MHSKTTSKTNTNLVDEQSSSKLENAYSDFYSCLKIIDYKPKHFFEHYYLNVIDDRDDDIETKRFYEKHKKKLQRKSHSLNELSNFINYITKLDDFVNKGWIKPVCISEDEIDAEFEADMKEISQLVTKLISKNRDNR